MNKRPGEQGIGSFVLILTVLVLFCPGLESLRWRRPVLGHDRVMNLKSIKPIALAALTSLGLTGVSPLAEAKDPEVILNESGKKWLEKYAAELSSLESEIETALPPIDEKKKQAFLDARKALAGLQAPGDDASGPARKKYDEDKTLAETEALARGRVILEDLKSFLESDKLDAKLMKASIIRNATPRGLAEFSQQGAAEETLLARLFDDEALMKQVLKSGGANGGEYGEAMQVYTAILEKSERAREVGSIFQRLALGTALHQPWLEGKEKGGVYGIVLTDNQTPDGQVARYLHYEKAFLAGELDPQFKDFNAWECRFITNDPYTNEELTWGRAMLRQFRPDHITNPDQKWRYTRVVKSDLPYCSTRHDDSLGLPQQQALALGGICGRRAFFGRFIARAFGIPSRRSTQTGHAAMNRWTPDGWVVNFGAWWSMNWCGPQGGLDFYLDSQAREHEETYLQILRAQWIGDALGQEDVSLRHYGQGGGFWDGLAFYQKRAIVDDANQERAAADAELAALTAEEARLLGESDKVLGDDQINEIEIPEEDRKITVSADGVMTIPAAACDRPKNSTDKVVFMPSWDEGTQIHYGRLGERPELIKYTVEAPAAGHYEVTAKVATVSPKLEIILRINRRTLHDMPLPYTKGFWEESKPVTVELKEGRNTIMITCRAPNRGFTLKELAIKPAQ